MNEAIQTESQANKAQTQQPTPSIWTMVWPLLCSISAFAAAYFAFNGRPLAMLLGLLAGAFMLLGQLSKPKVSP